MSKYFCIKDIAGINNKYFQQLPQSIFVFSAFLFAVLLRITFAIEWHNMPYGTAPLLDAKSYDEWALSILSGHWFSSHAFYQSPLYPYLLALLYSVFGHSYLAASFLNAFLDSITVSLLSQLSFTFYGRGAGFITAFLAATYAPMIFYTGPLMKEPLMLLLLTAFLYASLWCLKENRLRTYALAGVFFALAVLARGNLLLLFPVLPTVAWIRYQQRARRGILLFVLATLIPLIPVTLHNVIVSHDFVPLTYADGFNLYIGHSPYANGTNAYPPEVSTDPEQERLNTEWIAENEEHKKLLPSQVSAFWRHKAIAFALDNPIRELQLLGLKIFGFWNDAESFDNYDLRFIKQNFPSLLNLPLSGFWLVGALAIFKIVSLRKKDDRQSRYTSALLIVSMTLYMFGVVIFYVTDRYRLPVVIFLFPLAGSAIPTAMRLWKNNHRPIFLIAAVTALLSLMIILHKPLNPTDLSAFDWGVLTTIYADKSDPKAAFDAFQKGFLLSPETIGAQAFIRSAELKENQGQQAEADQLVEKAAELYPTDGVALYNLGRLEVMHGEWDKAIKSLNQSLMLSPTYGLTYFALAKIYKKIGDNEKAKNMVRKGLEINPEDDRLLSLTKSRDLE